MNDRIQELVEQSGISLYKKDVLDKHFPELYDSVYCELSVEQLEKFAELIVRECLSFTNPSPHEGTEFGEALTWAHKNIKDHFGIKYE